MSLLAVACPGGPVVLCDVYGTQTNNERPDDRTLPELWESLLDVDAQDRACGLLINLDTGQFLGPKELRKAAETIRKRLEDQHAEIKAFLR